MCLLHCILHMRQSKWVMLVVVHCYGLLAAPLLFLWLGASGLSGMHKAHLLLRMTPPAYFPPHMLTLSCTVVHHMAFNTTPHHTTSHASAPEHDLHTTQKPHHLKHTCYKLLRLLLSQRADLATPLHAHPLSLLHHAMAHPLAASPAVSYLLPVLHPAVPYPCCTPPCLPLLPSLTLPET